jgi:hypothetical protein
VSTATEILVSGGSWASRLQVGAKTRTKEATASAVAVDRRIERDSMFGISCDVEV